MKEKIYLSSEIFFPFCEICLPFFGNVFIFGFQFVLATHDSDKKNTTHSYLMFVTRGTRILV